MPSPINKSEVKYSKPSWIFSFSLNVSATVDAHIATTRHQIVPVNKKAKPKKRNDRNPKLETGSINCGRKARKNNAIFGFNRFVVIPCR
ncbi:MAG: hypothetical protein QG646_2688 [Euryarchaeota archaeon]|nr:hypothetical protein [Euryarchaeota archaeon]